MAYKKELCTAFKAWERCTQRSVTAHKCHPEQAQGGTACREQLTGGQTRLWLPVFLTLYYCVLSTMNMLLTVTSFVLHCCACNVSSASQLLQSQLPDDSFKISHIGLIYSCSPATKGLQRVH